MIVKWSFMMLCSTSCMLGMIRVESGPQLAERIKSDIKKSKTFDQIYEDIDDLISFQSTISPTKFDEVLRDVLADALERVRVNINNPEQRIAIQENLVTGLGNLAARVRSDTDLYTELSNMKNLIENLLASPSEPAPRVPPAVPARPAQPALITMEDLSARLMQLQQQVQMLKVSMP